MNKRKYLVWIEKIVEQRLGIGNVYVLSPATKLFDVSDSDIPEGWAIMDGVANLNPGSGRDLRDKFPPLPTLSKDLEG